MFCKKILFLYFFILLTNCTTNNISVNKQSIIKNNPYTNKGFALIYDKNLYEKKIISKKIDERSLVIFQKNLAKDTKVKITNLINDKSIIATVGNKSPYPSFNNSVLSIRVADEISLNKNEPYVEILELLENSLFIAKKVKMFDEEKKVASKAPVNTISINDLNATETHTKDDLSKKFSYNIKIADFYYNDTAMLLVKRINNETVIKNIKIKKIAKNKYRVFLGPLNNINALQKSFNDISILEFENIEIIKND